VATEGDVEVGAEEHRRAAFPHDSLGSQRGELLDDLGAARILDRAASRSVDRALPESDVGQVRRHEPLAEENRNRGRSRSVKEASDCGKTFLGDGRAPGWGSRIHEIDLHVDDEERRPLPEPNPFAPPALRVERSRVAASMSRSASPLLDSRTTLPARIGASPRRPLPVTDPLFRVTAT
jgi:hypothetical protein